MATCSSSGGSRGGAAKSTAMTSSVGSTVVATKKVETETPKTGRSLSSTEISNAEKEINKKGFTALGGGNWEFTGPYTIGAQILDESGSSRVGFATKAYSIRTWRGTDISPTRYFGTLNAAKTAAKEEMKEWLKSTKTFT